MIRTTATAIGATVLLCVFIALAIAQARRLTIFLGLDYGVYAAAVEKAWRGADPYVPHNIGSGYVYPPPSLLLFKAVEQLAPSGRASLTFIVLSMLAVLAALALLVCPHVTPERLYWCILLLTSSGVIESTYIGQVNAMVVLLLVLFWWAWQRDRHVLACAALAGAICLKTSPAVFALLFLTRTDWRWVLLLAAFVTAALLGAQAVVPAAHLNASFVAAFSWASQQPLQLGWMGSSWNYSLSISGAPLLNRVAGTTLSGLSVHWGKLTLLMWLAGSAAYLARDRSATRTRALFVTCNICMVVAPTLVWLHHGTLLLPALWTLLETGSVPLRALTLLALLCFQSTRWLQFDTQVPPSAPFAVGQLLLVLACAVYMMQAARETASTEPV